jgi:hypothetical protein
VESVPTKFDREIRENARVFRYFRDFPIVFAKQEIESRNQIEKQACFSNFLRFSRRIFFGRGKCSSGQKETGAVAQHPISRECPNSLSSRGAAISQTRLQFTCCQGTGSGRESLTGCERMCLAATSRLGKAARTRRTPQSSQCLRFGICGWGQQWSGYGGISMFQETGKGDVKLSARAAALARAGISLHQISARRAMPALLLKLDVNTLFVLRTPLHNRRSHL